MKALSSLAILSVISLFFSCKGGEREDEVITPNIRTLQAYEKEMVSASFRFALDLFRQLQQDNLPNQFFSPYSIHQALAMTMNGNEGDILKEFLDILHFEGMSLEEANKAAKELTEFLLEVDPKVKTAIANAIWYRQGLQVKAPFRDQVTDYYAAEISPLDMGNPQAKDIINHWIENRTEGMIKDMLDAIPAEAVMYLVNAIYFKGDWKYQFSAANTKKAPFHITPNQQVQVDMMELDNAADIRLSQSEGVTYLEIPYSTGQYSMGVLVSETHELQKLADELTLEQLDAFREKATDRSILLKMPKFKLRQKIEDLRDRLSSMGLITPFGPHPENFSQLFENLSGNLEISRVIHDAVIEVDEKGTEAAAATIVEISLTSMPTGPVVYALDKPFLFFIQEKHCGAILFMGKLTDPDQLD